MSEEQLAAIEARDKARYQGTWFRQGFHICINCNGDPRYSDTIAFLNCDRPTAEANAAFIAACSEDIPKLLAEVRRLQAKVKAYQREWEEMFLLRDLP